MIAEKWYALIAKNDTKWWQGEYNHMSRCFVKIPNKGWYLEKYDGTKYYARKATNVEVALFQLGGVIPDE